MKNYLYLLHLILFLFFFYTCDRPGELKVQVTTCPKQITLSNLEFTDTGFTKFNIFHEGFCFRDIDSIRIIKKFVSGSNNVYLRDSLDITHEKFNLYNTSDDNSYLNVKIKEPSDTAETIAGSITAIYKNQSKSNTVEFTYQLPCKKHIGQTATKLIDTMSCNTTAGTGDRHLITFEHQGYCIPEIDSISGYGEFYSTGGFFWNSSTFLIPRERITFQKDNNFLQKISFKLCVTNNYSDYVDTRFYLIYKDGSKSNVSKFRILFDYQNEKKTSESQFKQKIE